MFLFVSVNVFRNISGLFLSCFPECVLYLLVIVFRKVYLLFFGIFLCFPECVLLMCF
ncbi:unnamed protein product [Meloidogyne enterolobii]|uniref:Uncharacterized protein n=1 Tax=Meloidogyne enterolobii TaxID=390850 RepID=A0ACB1AJQ2_MELEN